MRKRLLAIILTLAMALALLPVTAAAEEDGSDENDFTIDSSGVLTKYNGSGGDVAIPAGVTSIGSSAFSGCAGLNSVTIPAGVTSIGSSAFSGCTGLNSVTIPSSVTSIGYYAFDGCTSLTSVDIPVGVTSIGNCTFYGCTSLTRVDIPEGVTRIGTSAFNGCTDLNSLTIPSTVTSIGNYAFDGCASLTGVTIPSSVTSIGEQAFSSCTSLSEIQVQEGNTRYISKDGALFTQNMKTLIAYPAGKSGEYAIPEGVTSIRSSAFRNCAGLTSVTIPSSATSIGNSAFNGCASLASVTIPEGVTSIENYTFNGCTSLTSVDIPKSVGSIGYFAFDGCTSLEKVNYGGTQAAWNRITIVSGNEPLNAPSTNISYVEAGGPTYTVIYKDGVDGTVFADYKIDGLEAGEPTPSFDGGRDPTRAGYAFMGWELLNKWSGLQPTIQAGDANDGVITYTATWERDNGGDDNGDVDYQEAEYRVIWYDAGGEEIGEPDYRYGNVGDFVFTTASDRYIEGYTFDSSDPRNVLQDTLSSDGRTVLKLYFIKNVTLTYDASGGRNAPRSETKAKGSSFTVSPLTPIREGFTFSGWSVSPGVSDVTYVSGDVIVLNADTTLYAVWEAAEITVGWIWVDGFHTGSAAIIRTDPDSSKYPADPTTGDSDWVGHILPDYMFIGWDPPVPGSGGNVYTALWVRPDMDITITPDRPVVAVGDNVTYTITVTNKIAENVTVDIACGLPEGLEFINVDGGGSGGIFDGPARIVISSGGGLYDGTARTVTWGGVRMVGYASTTLTVEARAVTAGEVTNNATATLDYGTGTATFRSNDATVNVASPPEPEPGPELPEPGPEPDPVKPDPVEPDPVEPDPVEPVLPPIYRPSTPTDTPGKPANTPKIPALIPSPIQDEVIRTDRLEIFDWIDRLVLPGYAQTFYDVMAGGRTDAGKKPGIFEIEQNFVLREPAGGGAAQVEEIEVAEFSMLDMYADGKIEVKSTLFQDENFYSVPADDGDKAVNYAGLEMGGMVRTSTFSGVFITTLPRDGEYDAKKKETCEYIAAVFHAFDRDHPEVFWLSGKCKTRIVTVTDPGAGEKTAYFFLVLADKEGFTMCSPDWTGSGAITEGIARRDAAVAEILETVTASGTADKIRQINKYLTEHNQYNTTPDLTTIGNEPHECLSALEGRIGTNGPVCDGYSRACKVLCDRLSIPCVLETGWAMPRADITPEFHMWNLIQVEGTWYGADVTWDDPSVKGIVAAISGKENENYLLIGSDTVVSSLTFGQSHVVRDQAAEGGVDFNNGPAMSPIAYSGITVPAFKDVPADAYYYDGVLWALDRGITAGASADAFSPDAPCTQIQILTFLWRSAGKPRVDAALPVSVTGADDYVSAAKWACSKGMIGADFDQNALCTRACAMKFMWQAEGSPAAASVSVFTDVPAGADYAQAVAWAVAKGITSGTSATTFAPDQICSRGQIVAFLCRDRA